MKKKGRLQAALDKKDRRGQIIQAAAFVFRKSGYDRASLQEIAARVGISKSTLYHYFKSKHDLLYIINYGSITDAIERMNKIAEMPISPEEKIQKAFEQHFSAYVTHHPGLLVMLHEKTDLLPPRMEKEINREFKKYARQWERFIQEGVEAGIIRPDLDLKMMAWSALGMSNWVYKWASSRGRLKFSQIAQIFSAIFLEGVSASNTKKSGGLAA